ncbi:hypothetical protein [Catenulispora subtropica]|uniref:Uncharacterized protein n=1 Tax=Catenulispora subtropica TaxID=450798 RepID=A0ABP5EX83_9ACTN
MSVADRDRLVFEEYAYLSRHLSGVWRRERARCLAGRWGWCVLTGFARAGLAMVGVSPYEVDGKPSPAARLGGAPHADEGDR